MNSGKLLPNFLIVGAAKSGTTSLWEVLRKHPQIFVPDVKEGRFFSKMPRTCKGGRAAAFANDGPRDINSYLELYRNNEDKVRGDISNDYFYFFERSIIEIKKYYNTLTLPKIIIVLRNPIERIYSMYYHILRLGSDNLSFEEALALSKKRVEEGYAWMFDLYGVGMSADAVDAYRQNFKEVRVYLTEDMSAPGFLKDLFRFIGLPPIEASMGVRMNANTYAKPIHMSLNKYLNDIIPRTFRRVKPYIPSSFFSTSAKKFMLFVSQLNNGPVESMNQETKESLRKFFIADVSRLSFIVDRDLSHWFRR